MKSFNDNIFVLMRLFLMICLTTTWQLPHVLAAVTATGDLSIVPTTYTTYLEGNIETKATTTEAYPTLFDDSDIFGNIQKDILSLPHNLSLLFFLLSIFQSHSTQFIGLPYA